MLVDDAEPTEAHVSRTGDEDVVTVRIEGGRAGLADVDRLARLALELKRLGCTLRVEEPSPSLLELLDLCGLSHLAAPGNAQDTL